MLEENKIYCWLVFFINNEMESDFAGEEEMLALEVTEGAWKDEYGGRVNRYLVVIWK